MSNNFQEWDDDDFDFEDELEQPRSADTGTDLVKKLRKAQRAAEKRNKELESELLSLRSAQRENVIKSLLAEKGLNPKVAKLIPNDIESNADALTQWIEENADIFGIQPSSPANAETQVDLATLRQIDSVTSNAITPDKAENILLRLDQATSAEDIINMIYSQE